MHSSTSTAPRYRQVAQRVTRLIEKGALKSGERIPSIRNMSRQEGVAITTVIEAYRLLEDQGLVEARPQSAWTTPLDTPTARRKGS